MSEAKIKPLEIIKNFDALSADLVVDRKVAAIMMNMTERTLRRDPPIPEIKLSPQRIGFRVGAIRSFVRRDQAAA